MRGSQFSLMLTGLLIVLFIGLGTVPAAAGEPLLMRIDISDAGALDRLVKMDLDITTVSPGKYAEAYLVEKERLDVMAEGFTVYEYEWWHFDYKDWRAYRIENRTFEEILSSN